MSRKTYIVLITILFGITYVPDLLSVLFKERILIDYIPRPTLKLVLFFLIGFMESTLMKTDKGGVVGWLLMIGFIIGAFFRVSHWYDGRWLIWCTTSALFLLWLFFAYKERNKELLNYLLWSFIVIRVAIYNVVVYGSFRMKAQSIPSTNLRENSAVPIAIGIPDEHRPSNGLYTL